jgi:hypothetical protein
MDFPFLCLHMWQPPEVIQRMARILCTSVFADSFGPITSSNQRASEGLLLDQATQLLVTLSREHKKYSATQMLEMRMELLQFLGCVASTEMGMAALAKHDRAVLRISLRIAEELDACYDWRPGERIRLVFFPSISCGKRADGGTGLNSLTSR